MKFTHKALQVIGALTVSALLSGCGALSLFEPEPTKTSTLDIPPSWQTRLKSGGSAHNWVRRFKSPELNDFVEEALKNNYNLKTAALRIDQLRASELLTKRRQRPSISSSTGTSSSGDSSELNLTPSSYRVSFGSNWEFDLWGRLKAQQELAELNTLEAQSDFYATRLSLASSTANAYFNLISAQNSKQLADQTLAHFQNSLRIIERNYKAGIPGTDALDVQFGRNNITSAKRRLAASELSLVRSAQTLETLLGRYPSGTLRAKSQLPQPLSTFPNVVPSEALELRPDLLSARRSLNATLISAQIQKLELLPSFSLQGRINGSSGVSLQDLLDPGELSWSLGTSISHALFDNKVQKTEIKQTMLRYESSINSYTQNTISALREIEFALHSENSLARQSQLLAEEVKVSTLAETQSQRDYTQGLNNGNILSVLEAQRRAVNARSTLINIKNERLRNQVALFTAIGGNPVK